MDVKLFSGGANHVEVEIGRWLTENEITPDRIVSVTQSLGGVSSHTNNPYEITVTIFYITK